MTAQDSSQEAKAVGKDFHLKEFELLRKAHDAAEDRLVTIIQYVLLFSAVVYSFLVNQKDKLPAQAAIVWSLPFVASVVGIFVLYGIVRSIQLKDAYFCKLECCYGNLEQKLGWVHFKGNRGITKASVVPIATVIAGLNFVAGAAGIWYDL